MHKFITNSYKQTQKLGGKLAKELIKLTSQKGAVVLGLEGDLGGGKTTFLQGFAKGLGIKEKILSPTFVLIKRFKMNKKYFKNFYHVDCYRISGAKDLEELGFKDIILNPENIIVVEWSERIKKILPKPTIIIKFDFMGNNKRKIIIYKPNKMV